MSNLSFQKKRIIGTVLSLGALIAALDVLFDWRLFGEADGVIAFFLFVVGLAGIYRFGPSPAEVREHFKEKTGKSE